MDQDEWFPCEWKPLEPRLFSARSRMILVGAVVVAVVLGVVFYDLGAGTLIFILVFLPGVVGTYLISRYPANSYWHRDIRGMPFVGEYAVARGYLFLRMKERFDYKYLKPHFFRILDETTVWVKGSWWQRYRIHLGSREGMDELVVRLADLGAQERNG